MDKALAPTFRIPLEYFQEILESAAGISRDLMGAKGMADEGIRLPIQFGTLAIGSGLPTYEMFICEGGLIEFHEASTSPT